MAYSSTNPPQLISQRFGGNGPGIWSYKSTDPIATVAGSSYFSNGDALGMQEGDFVAIWDTNSTLGSWGVINAITSDAGATLISVLATT